MATKDNDARWRASGRRWDEADARAALMALRESGLSVDDFANAHGFSGQRLRAWRARLADSMRGERTGTKLVPVVVRNAVPVGARPSAAIVVTIGRAAVELRDTHSVDPEWFARFVCMVGGEP